jgi:hypothetical protein
VSNVAFVGSSSEPSTFEPEAVDIWVGCDR